LIILVVLMGACSSAPEIPVLSPGDVELGMRSPEVRRAWGDPREVQVAGDPRQGNEKWVYDGESTFGLTRTGARIVYFERGQVVGWESAY